MNIFFDVQGTLVDAGRARPHAREVVQTLLDDGHHVYIWSSGGRAYAKNAARLLEIDDLAFGYLSKSEPPPVNVDFAVDDHAALVRTFGGYVISPFDGDPNDAELRRVVEEVRVAARSDG